MALKKKLVTWACHIVNEGRLESSLADEDNPIEVISFKRNRLYLWELSFLSVNEKACFLITQPLKEKESRNKCSKDHAIYIYIYIYI